MENKNDNSLIGFFASFQIGEIEKDTVRSYLWGENGLTKKLESISNVDFGKDFNLILYQVYVKQSIELLKHLREIESYRSKERAIGIPIVINQENFFNLSESDRQLFFKEIILSKLDLLKIKVKRNKLDLDVEKLKNKIDELL